MSKDGSLVATTTFVTGHSYAQASFSTETIIRRDGKSLGNLETWDVEVDGRPLTAVDRNFWGVTFAADDDTFYVTAASGGTTWLMKGSLSAKKLTSLRTDAECPSLSPDETKVAYKKRLGNTTPGIWRIAVLDLATGKETLTATCAASTTRSSGWTTTRCCTGCRGPAPTPPRPTSGPYRPTAQGRPRSSSSTDLHRRW